MPITGIGSVLSATNDITAWKLQEDLALSYRKVNMHLIAAQASPYFKMAWPALLKASSVLPTQEGRGAPEPSPLHSTQELGILWRSKYRLCPEITALVDQSEGRCSYKPNCWIYFFLKDHRRIQVGRDVERSLVQPPAQSRVTCEIAQVFVQAALESLQQRSLHSLSGWPPPLPACPHEEKVAPYIQPEPLLFQLSAIVSHPARHHCKSVAPSPWSPPCWYRQVTIRSSCSNLFPRLSKPQPFSLLSVPSVTHQLKKTSFAFSALAHVQRGSLPAACPQMLGGEEVGRVAQKGLLKWDNTCASWDGFCSSVVQRIECPSLGAESGAGWL